MKSFELTIVTPERVTFEGRVAYLSLPAWGGSLGVLPGHISMLVLLREGMVVMQMNELAEFLCVSGGFAEISPTKTVLFAETAELASEINAERARASLARANAVLTQKKREGYEEIDVDAARAGLRRALVRLKVFEDYRRKRSQGFVHRSE